MIKLKDDLLYKRLVAGEATAEDQSYAAEWIAKLMAAVEDAHCFLTSKAKVSSSQRIENARVELENVLTQN